jgi:hypothetical protein
VAIAITHAKGSKPASAGAPFTVTVAFECDTEGESYRLAELFKLGEGFERTLDALVALSRDGAALDALLATWQEVRGLAGPPGTVFHPPG